jgi:hypothetical protein
MKRYQIIILCLGIAVLAWLALYGPGATHRRAMRAADALRQQVQPKLASDPRFSRVSLSVWTHPSLQVLGEVPDEAALRDLERLVQAPPDAPFRVMFGVNVASTAATLPAAH